MPKRYEYTEMVYVHHAKRDALDRLNALGAKGWAPAFYVGRTLILVREIDNPAIKELPDADIEDWRAIYPELPDEELADMDADGVAALMGGRFDLPTRATLNRWAQEARESADS